jgi:hypothetical protein
MMGKMDRIEKPKTIEDRAARVVRAKILIPGCGFKIFLDKAFDPY